MGLSVPGTEPTFDSGSTANPRLLDYYKKHVRKGEPDFYKKGKQPQVAEGSVNPGIDKWLDSVDKLKKELDSVPKDKDDERVDDLEDANDDANDDDDDNDGEKEAEDDGYEPDDLEFEHARLRERSLQFWVPVFAVVDLRKAPAAVFKFVVRAQ